jgi:hypothetical protein
MTVECNGILEGVEEELSIQFSYQRLSKSDLNFILNPKNYS